MKQFLEVFDKIDIDDSALRNALESSYVDNIVASDDKTLINIDFYCDKLIQKNDIKKLERQIKNYYFNRTNLTVKLVVKYDLNGQYTPENFYKAYKDSIEEEAENYSMVLYVILNNADISFDDNIVKVVIEDTPLYREKTDEVRSFFEMIFNTRCNFKCIIDIQYKDKNTNIYREINDHETKMMVKDICERLSDDYVEDDNTVIKAGRKSSLIITDDEPIKAEGADLREKEDNGDKKENKEAEPGAKAPKKEAATGGSGNKKDKGKFQKKDKFDGAYRKKRHFKVDDDSDLLFGRAFHGDEITLKEAYTGYSEVIVKGKIIKIDNEKEIREGTYLYIFVIYDLTESIGVKVFCDSSQIEELRETLAVGKYVKLKGSVTEDSFSGDVIIDKVRGIYEIQNFMKVAQRMDYHPNKRVELHLHTNFSEMDAVTPVDKLIQRAVDWGMNAMAITDHAVVQSFPIAYHYLQDKVKTDFKLIYGVEAYMVDDSLVPVKGATEELINDDFVVINIKTTGLSNVVNKIVEINAIKFVDGEVKESFHKYVNPLEPVSYKVEDEIGISNAKLAMEDSIYEVLPEFLAFVEGYIIVGHNLDFAYGFIKKACEYQNVDFNPVGVDTMELARNFMDISRFKLETVCKHVKIKVDSETSASLCKANGDLYLYFAKELTKKNLIKLTEINDFARNNKDRLVKYKPYHVIILAKNDIGRLNLYRIVSTSHVEYLRHAGKKNIPVIPRSYINEHREGLIVGSACSEGELFKAILENKEDDIIASIVNFYDYLEIQPLGNNEYLLREGLYGIESRDDLIDLNKKIVSLGEQFDKPVCATCDVHFMDPEDEIYRRIIQFKEGFADADKQPPIYFRTTDEMLKEFGYLGPKKAEEVVITNTNLIADMVEVISPVHPDKCPPEIPHSDEMLRKICYDKAHAMYGDPLPEVVQSRLDTELNSIINAGYANLYIIAQKLVWKSNEDGYLVGSRGSVGSSLVATMAGISEVNPLPPHYYCTKCQYSDFTSPEVEKYSQSSGVDMPDRICPKCGEKLTKDGFNIPFATFLGFKANKEPDIDLNFSGEYQAKAHRYTEVIFGQGQTFRAGTYGTVAEKTAYAYVDDYYVKHGENKRRFEKERISQGCTNIKRSSGQHPGGIIVLPLGREINEFTPIQKAEDDEGKVIITTHFEYHAIDNNLLKLDILGHDDPSMLKMLQDLSGINPNDIPIDDRKILSLFQTPDVLGITSEQINGCKTGTRGIPEFGTDLAIDMLVETNPQSVADLVRISGLSHGTDVWRGNAQTLIQEGKCILSSAICCRDDIMVYLIHKGIEPETAFNIIENVRKGKVAKGKCDKWEEWKQIMIDHGIPDWYIWSCEKIQYMFPKAHAAAYVTLACRIAYFKIYHPLVYYAAFFSIRAKGFNYEKIVRGKDRFYSELKRVREQSANGKLNNTDKDFLNTANLVEEMFARGFDFMPIDMSRVNASKFQIIDGKLMPSLDTIDGVGGIADKIVNASKGVTFFSREDFKNKTGCPETISLKLKELGILGNIPDQSQLTLFDFM